MELTERYKLNFAVAPREGAWIEIFDGILTFGAVRVAPREGAWIEISSSRTRGSTRSVAPREGAWIEIFVATDATAAVTSRSPRGSVD